MSLVFVGCHLAIFKIQFLPTTNSNPMWNEGIVRIVNV